MTTTLRFFRNGETKSIVAARYNNETGYMEAWTYRGEAVTPADMLSILPRFISERALNRYRPEGAWRIDTCSGMSGCADLRFIVRDYEFEDMVGYPTSGRVVGFLHVSCKRKLNQGVRGRLEILLRLLEVVAQRDAYVDACWAPFVPVEFDGSWNNAEAWEGYPTYDGAEEDGPDGLPKMADDDEDEYM